MLPIGSSSRRLLNQSIFQRGVFDGVEQPPWPTPMDDLGLEQADHCFGERATTVYNRRKAAARRYWPTRQPLPAATDDPRRTRGNVPTGETQ